MTAKYIFSKKYIKKCWSIFAIQKETNIFAPRKSKQQVLIPKMVRSSRG